MSLSPLLTSTSAEGGTEESGIPVDTGWVQLDLTDPDGDNLSTADFHHLVPYGVQMSDISLQIQVDGANDLFLENPRIWSPASDSMVLDWSSGPGLGRLLDFSDGDPHNGRMAPQSDTTATWQIPNNATVTDVIIEALRPVDPLVSLTPYMLDIQAHAVHPDDGRLYLAVSGDSLLILDASASPSIIDRIEGVDLISLAVDVGNDRILGLEKGGNILCWQLIGGAQCTPLSNAPSSSSQMALDSSGHIWVAGAGHLHVNDGNGWQEAISSDSDSQWPDEPTTDILFLGDEILVSTDGGGIARWNRVADTRLSGWSTANHLPSDHISILSHNDGTLFVGTTDEGLARKDLASGNWLAVWHDGNWLSSNHIVDLSANGNSTSILTDVGLHVYNTVTASFTGESMLPAMGLNHEGMDLVSWPTGGLRAPTQSALMVSDGSGRLAVLDALAAPQALGDLLLATTPTNEHVHDVLEIDGILYAAGDLAIDRFDVRARAWLSPLFPEHGVNSITTDGNRLFSVGDELSIDVWASNGTHADTITMGMSADPTALAWDALTGSLLIAMGDDGLGRIEMSTGSIDVWNENDEFQRGYAFDVVARNGIAFVAIEGEGVARVNLITEEILGSWRSSDVDDVEHAPIAVGGDRVYLGLYDAGVFVFDRDTGEIVETWAESEEDWWWWLDDMEEGEFASLPNPWVLSLHVDVDGEVYVGHEMGFVRRSADGFENPDAGDIWFGGRTTAFASEGSKLYALQEFQGLCVYERDDLSLITCWNSNPRSNIEIDTTDGNSLTIPSPNRIYVSTDHGAYLIDTLNETILQSWSTGGSTWNTPVVVWNDVAHLAVDGIGVARYDLDTQQWLSPWNAASGQLPNNGVTALSDDISSEHLWVGGDFGLVELDMRNGNQLNNWDDDSDPRVSPRAPQQLVRIDEVLHYLETPPERRNLDTFTDIFDGDDFDFILQSEDGEDGTEGRQRPGGGGGGNQGFGQPATRVFRYDVDSEEKLSDLRPSFLSPNQNQLSIIGMENVRGDELWIGIGKPNSYHWSNDPAGIARWDANAEQWLDDIEPESSVEDEGLVAFLGDCDSTSILADSESCIILSSFGDDYHRMMWLDGTVESEPSLEGPIRAAVTWDGYGLLASPDGVLRVSTSNWNFVDPWEAGDGLPPSASNNVRSLEVIGDDLWMITKSSSSSSSSQIHRLNGSTNQWMTWSGSSTDEIPDGTGITIEMCADIIHFGFYGEVWDGEGGIARYDPIQNEWLEPFESEFEFDFDNGGRQEQDGLYWASVTALACDTEDILYVGTEEGEFGIQRYDYGEEEWMDPIYPDDFDMGWSGVAHDAMYWANSILAFGHVQGGDFNSEGSFSTIPVLGDWTGNGRSVDHGISTTSIVPYPQLPGNSVDWLVAQPGANGPGRAKMFNSLGDDFGTMGAWTGMTDGRVRHFAGNSSHVYAAFLSSGSARTDGASTILEGTILANGDVDWARSWELDYASIERLFLQDGLLWVTTRNSGLHRIDLSTGDIGAMPPASHESLSFMTLHDGDLVIGLSAVEMAAGVAVFDLNNEQFIDGALIPGLPSPIVEDVVEYDGSVWFATPGGVGSWDIAANSWGPTVSVAAGLPSSDVRGLEIAGGELWVATFGGLCAVNPSSPVTSMPNVQQCLTRNQGLTGTSTADIASAGGLLYASHDGFGPTRPGATQVRGVDRNALLQYHADSLPSNDVTAIAADGWGVHIATEEEPLSHWNAITNQMENGAVASDTNGWPITSLSSNGQTLLAGTTGLMHRISVQGVGHPVINSTGAPGIIATFQGQYGTWVAAGEDGVRPFGPSPGYEMMPQVVDKRATPLRATIGVEMTDITTAARPDNSITLDLGTGVLVGEENDALSLAEVPLIFSSDIEGAAVWARTTQVDYSGTWNIANSESAMRALLEAVAFGDTNSTGHDLHLRFDSPSNGSIKVRLTYTAIPSDSPVQMLLLEDRPNDGGDALVAMWTPTLETGFSAYELYYIGANEQTPNSITIPSRFDVQTVITGLDDAEGYTAWVEVVYSNGNHSNSSNTIGPVSPFDDIPLAPSWANTELSDTEVLVEWEYCSALDYQFSQFDYSISPLEPLDSFSSGWQGEDVNPASGDNSTSIPLLGTPVWARIYCVDTAWQIDLPNPLIIGPISTSLENDTDAPEPLDWVLAEDHPDDSGGVLDISWAESEADDCALYAVHLTPVSGAWPPVSADEAPVVEWIEGCENTDTMIGGLDDGQAYWVTVVAYDTNLNADPENSPWDEGMPLADLRETDAPARVESVSASDIPSDSGHAIEVSWTPSIDSDVVHYTVWVSEHDVSDVSSMWSRCSFYLDTCAEMVMVAGISDTMVIDKALYGDSLNMGIRLQIQPDVELFVSVSAHDGDGNVFLDSLVTTSVMPIDDLRDTEAPPRMDRPTLSDVVNDYGNALWMEFTPSGADDVAWYAIYVESYYYEETCELQPAMLLPVDAEQPLLLDRYSSGRFLEPTEQVTVAIVAVDASANVNCADILPASMTPIADAEPVEVESPVSDLTAEWIYNGTALEITWDRTESARAGLSIYISDSRFTVTGESVQIAVNIRDDTFIITTINGEPIDSSKYWWIAVTNDHAAGEIIQVSPLEVPPFGVGTESSDDLFSVMSLVLALVGVLIVLAAITTFFVLRRARSKDDFNLDQSSLVSGDMDRTNDLWKSTEDDPLPMHNPPLTEVPSMNPAASTADDLPSMAEGNDVDTSFLDDLI